MKLSKSLRKNNSGFTLVELLLVITIISTLAVTVFVALNPSTRIKAAKDSRRQADVDSILSAIHLYINDNGGSLPTGLTTGMLEKQIGTATTGCTIATGGCNVVATNACVDLTTPMASYLKSLPKDPQGGTAGLSKYSVIVDANGIVTVKACGTEGATNIEASR